MRFEFKSTHQAKSSSGRRYRGSAVVEFVIVLPFFFLIVGATIELCSVSFLKQSLTIAAYEGARVAVRRGGTVDNTEARILAILSQRGVTVDGATAPVTITPDPATAQVLDPIVVRVRAPLQQNTIIPFSWLRLMRANEVEGRVVLRKEIVTVPE
jgi:Flp pilus assembly protein TadG